MDAATKSRRRSNEESKTKQGEHSKLEREATHRTRAGGPGRQVRPRRQWPTLPLTRLDDGERQGRRAWVPSRPNQRVENKINKKQLQQETVDKQQGYVL
jgi:hypothetical protein